MRVDGIFFFKYFIIDMQRRWLAQRPPKGLQSRNMESVFCREKRCCHRRNAYISCVFIESRWKSKWSVDCAVTWRWLFSIDMGTFYRKYNLKRHLFLFFIHYNCDVRFCLLCLFLDGNHIDFTLSVFGHRFTRSRRLTCRKWIRSVGRYTCQVIYIWFHLSVRSWFVN